MLSKRLENLRESKNWNKSQVADKLDIPRSTYSTYENGIHEPDINMLKKIARLYKVNVDFLIGNDYINVNDYILPNEITTIQQAVQFLENIKILIKDKTDEDIIKLAQVFFYLVNNKI